MEFATSSDPIVNLAFWTGIAVIFIIIFMVLYVIFLRYMLIREERRRKLFLDVWRPILIRSLESIPDVLPPVKKKDWPVLFNLWNHFHESLRGSAKDNLNEIARKAGMLPVAGSLLKKRKVKSRLAAITTLGLLRDKTVWEEIKNSSVDEHPSVSLAAMRALIRIDEERAMPFIIPLISARTDWPPARVANILHEASPHVICVALADAILHSPEPHIPLLIRYFETIACDSSTVVLRQAIEKFPNAAVISACLHAFKSPDALDIVRKNLTHAAWHVRVQAVRALGRMGLVYDKYILINMLCDQQWWVRYRAAQALSSLPFISTVDLEKIRDEQADRYAKDILIQVIAEKKMV